MREIGGYFDLERFRGQEYYSDLLALNSGRNALAYLIRARNIKKLYIPYYLCGCVAEICEREGCAFECYRIDKDFMPVVDSLADGGYLYLVNYFGQIQNRQIEQLVWQCGRVIVDNVQAFFQKPLPGVDTIYSCRKFFGVPDGGYLATDTRLDEELESDRSHERMRHVLGRAEEEASAHFLSHKENEKQIDEAPLRAMSRLTRNILRGVDYADVRARREANYAVLAARLDAANRIRVKMPEGPFCYPLYLENAGEIRSRLIANKIYVPVLWPNMSMSDDELARDYANNILPLPCDQRYDAADMEYILETLKLCGVNGGTN